MRKNVAELTGMMGTNGTRPRGHCRDRNGFTTTYNDAGTATRRASRTKLHELWVGKAAPGPLPVLETATTATAYRSLSYPAWELRYGTLRQLPSEAIWSHHFAWAKRLHKQTYFQVRLRANAQRPERI